MEFGRWDGMTFAEVGEQHPDELKSWLASLDVAPGGGESFRTVQARVLSLRSSGCWSSTPGRTVVVVSHVTPIKTIVAHAVDAPLESVFRMEADAGVGHRRLLVRRPPSMRMYNALPPGNDVFGVAATGEAASATRPRWPSVTPGGLSLLAVAPIHGLRSELRPGWLSST